MKKNRLDDFTKIKLSKEEVILLNDQQFFNSKKIITEKIFVQLNEIKREISNSITFQNIKFPDGTDIHGGKISKGENYLGYPYINIDFPKLFKGDQIFAFRTMVWWGNFAICTFLVSGNEMKKAQENLILNCKKFGESKVYVCVEKSPWHHHFEKSNYVRLKDLKKNKLIGILKEQSFLKVARKLPIKKINNLKSFALETFERLSPLMPK